MEKFIMHKRENKQIPIFEMLMRRELTQNQAAISLNLTTRQIRNKLRAYEKDGAKSLVHKTRGKPSKRRWDTEKEALAIELLRTDWSNLGFGPTFAVEQLGNRDIVVGIETFRKVMILHGLWQPKQKKAIRRRRRERRSTFGIMIQIDGSPHHWFGPEHPKCTLLVFIDDATSKIVWLEFVKAECVEGVMRATKHYMEKYGIPLSIYVDYGSVFSVNMNNKEHEKLTQYERAMKELGVETKHARSPQAKGRVERSNRTHQDRLVKELRLAKIATLEEANKFLPGYIEKHNAKFAVEPREDGDVHRPVDVKLDEIFVVRVMRLLKNDYTILYNKRILQIVDQQSIRYKPKDQIVVSKKLNGELILSVKGSRLEYQEVLERTPKCLEEKILNQKRRPVSENSRRWKHGNWQPKAYVQQPVYRGGF